MSGGTWQYQQYRLEEKADEIAKLLRAVAETEHIVDWAVCGIMLRSEAALELFALWKRTFNEIYGS